MLPNRTLQLSLTQAARWREALTRVMAAKSRTSGHLEPFLGDLEDACWLAGWKREHVHLELSQWDRPDLIQALLHLAQSLPSGADFDAFEEMVRAFLHDGAGASAFEAEPQGTGFVKIRPR